MNLLHWMTLVMFAANCFGAATFPWYVVIIPIAINVAVESLRVFVKAIRASVELMQSTIKIKE